MIPHALHNRHIGKNAEVCTKSVVTRYLKGIDFRCSHQTVETSKKE